LREAAVVSVPIFSNQRKSVSGPKASATATFSDAPKAAPTPKIRALVKFPGDLNGATGIEVTKSNGTWTVATDWSGFAVSSSVGATSYVLTYDTVSNVYTLVSTALLGGAGGGALPSNTNPIMDGTAAAGVSTLYSRGDHIHPHDSSKYDASNPNSYQTAAQVTTALTPYALIASPTFTGDPKAPTPSPGDNDTSIATTAFVTAAMTAAGSINPSNANPIMDSTAAPGTSALYSRGDHIHPNDTSKYNASNPSGYQTAAQVATAVAPYATIASPTFTGDPKAPTPTAGDNDTSIATTAFVTTATSSRVAKAGDTMTGALVLSYAEPTFSLNKPAGSHYNSMYGQVGGLSRWILNLGDNGTESGGNAGSDFGLTRFSDAGAAIDAPLKIVRSTGNITASSSLVVSSNITGDQIACAGATAGAYAGYFNTDTGISLLNTSGGFLSVSRAAQPCGSFNINVDGQNIAYCRSGNTVGNVSVTTTATAYNTSSSADLKEDLQSFDAGRIVDNTEVYNFKWRSTGERAYGVVAQEAVEVYPTAVFHNEDTDWWGVDYSKYVPVLLQELKALRARVAELEDKLTAKPS
jgi:hypothetical protein